MGIVYFSAIIDGFEGRVISWATGAKPKVDFADTTFDVAVKADYNGSKESLAKQRFATE